MKRHHHHDHGNDASVPAKGNERAVPGKQWEIQYNPLPAGKSTPAGAFDPKRSKDRPCAHNKVNESDH